VSLHRELHVRELEPGVYYETTWPMEAWRGDTRAPIPEGAMVQFEGFSGGDRTWMKFIFEPLGTYFVRGDDNDLLPLRRVRVPKE